MPEHNFGSIFLVKWFLEDLFSKMITNTHDYRLSLLETVLGSFFMKFKFPSPKRDLVELENLNSL